MHTNFRGSQEWRQERLPLTTGSNEACKLYDAAVAQIVGNYDDLGLGGTKGTLDKLVKADENFVMGHVVSTGLDLLGSGRNIKEDQPLADDFARLKELERKTPNLTTREKKHVHALDLWAQGHIDRAGVVWEDILVEHPTDALALKFAYTSHFFCGNVYQLRDSLARVLPHWKPETPLYGYIHGLYSFGLEETNLYTEAAKTANTALSINAQDAWALHTLFHVVEMQGTPAEGIQLMENSRQNWETNRKLACHLHWHWALYYLEIGDYESALTAFDQELKSRCLENVSVVHMADACTLLFRLQLEGVAVGDRWDDIYERYKDHLHGHVVMFHDFHLLLACLGAGRKEATRELMDSMERFIRDGRGRNREITARVGEAIMTSFTAFDDGDYATAVDSFLPVRYDVINIGGSNAHRDVFNLFLIQAAIKSPRKEHHELAVNLLNERKAWKPKSPMTDRLIAKTTEHQAIF